MAAMLGQWEPPRESPGRWAGRDGLAAVWASGRLAADGWHLRAQMEILACLRGSGGCQRRGEKPRRSPFRKPSGRWKAVSLPGVR